MTGLSLLAFECPGHPVPLSTLIQQTFIAGNLMRTSAIALSVIEGSRSGGSVTITHELTGADSISTRVVVASPSPRLSCRSKGDQRIRKISESATGKAVRRPVTGSESVTIAARGDGLVLIRQVSGREFLPARGYGLMIRDLNLVETNVQLRS